jgi:hypothetical protein
MVSFNMNYAMPYMTYQMAPMMMGSAGLAGAGMMGGTFGMPMMAPAGGLNLGLGLGGNALTAGFGTSALEMQLLRALLGRAAGNGTAPPPAAAQGDAEARLGQRIADLNTRIDTEMANLRQTRDNMQIAIREVSLKVRDLQEQFDKLPESLKKPRSK